MKKDLRKHIKQDEFATWLGRTVAFARAHEKEAKVTIGTLLVLGIGAFALNSFRDRRSRAMETDLATAIEAFHAPAADEAPADPERPPAQASTTAAEKYRKVVSQFEGLGRGRGSFPAGRRALYYAALSRAELGQFAEAEKLLGELASDKSEDSLEPHLARLELAELHRRSGQPEKAVTAYRQMADDAAFPLPRDHVLMRLSSLLEEMRRPGDARAAYRRLVEEFPGSIYAAEARRRADFLQIV